MPRVIPAGPAEHVTLARCPLARLERGRRFVVIGDGDDVEIGVARHVIDQVARGHQTVGCPGMQVQIGPAEGIIAG